MQLQDVKFLINDLWDLRQDKDRLKADLKELEGRIDETEHKIIEVLEAADLERFDGDHCTVFVQEKTSVKTPKTPEQRSAFFAFLKERGLFEEVVTVNSQWLNAWFRDVSEHEPGITIPGLEEPTIYSDIMVRKRK